MKSYTRRERETERGRERKRERQRGRERNRERQRGRERKRMTVINRLRQRKTKIHKETETETESYKGKKVEIASNIFLSEFSFTCVEVSSKLFHFTELVTFLLTVFFFRKLEVKDFLHL